MNICLIEKEVTVLRPGKAHADCLVGGQGYRDT